MLSASASSQCVISRDALLRASINMGDGVACRGDNPAVFTSDSIAAVATRVQLVYVTLPKATMPTHK